VSELGFRAKCDGICDWKSSLYLKKKNAEDVGENHEHKIWLKKEPVFEDQLENSQEGDSGE